MPMLAIRPSAAALRRNARAAALTSLVARRSILAAMLGQYRQCHPGLTVERYLVVVAVRSRPEVTATPGIVPGAIDTDRTILRSVASLAGAARERANVEAAYATLGPTESFVLDLDDERILPV